jgi:hypothetical protein
MTDWKTRQNNDGGWAYDYSVRQARGGCSWTEPTVYVLLAQAAAERDGASFAGGVRFLSSIARSDGGFSPQPGVEESTWVTALVALLPEEALGAQQRHRAITWLKGVTGQESGWRYRFQQWRNGDPQEYPEGWPWFPGAAAWVTPTSMGILAFERALRRGGADSGLEDRVQSGKKFLLGRMCADGGWNHGSNRALGRDGDSYPETTGIALVALNGVGGPQIEKAKAAARRHLTTCRTAEGIAWLRMGLAAHGEKAESAVEPVCRTNMDTALMAMASAERNLATDARG